MRFVNLHSSRKQEKVKGRHVICFRQQSEKQIQYFRILIIVYSTIRTTYYNLIIICLSRSKERHTKTRIIDIDIDIDIDIAAPRVIVMVDTPTAQHRRLSAFRIIYMLFGIIMLETYISNVIVL